MIVSYIFGFGAVCAISVACSYHIGWNRGWKIGQAVALGELPSEGSRRAQPVVRTIFRFAYGLGWHHGWDYGFRDGLQRKVRR